MFLATGIISLDLEQRSFSQKIVEESMILAGQVAAIFANENQFPIAFRTLEEVLLDDAPIEFFHPENEILKFFQRSKFSNSAITTHSAGKHAPIGLGKRKRNMMRKRENT